jgi:hypothetical protein
MVVELNTPLLLVIKLAKSIEGKERDKFKQRVQVSLISGLIF